MIEKSQIKEELETITRRNIDEIDEGQLLMDELGIDSLELLELIILIEKKYNIYIEDKEIINIKTTSDLLNYINERIKNENK